MPGNDDARDMAARNLLRLYNMTHDMFARMTPAERDRMKQEHLAAARGPANNLRLLYEMTEMLRRLRKATTTREIEDRNDV